MPLGMASKTHGGQFANGEKTDDAAKYVVIVQGYMSE